MSTTMPPVPPPGPAAPGTVTVVLAGHGPDLLKLELFLEAVTRGQHPAEALRPLRLAAITVKDAHAPRGRSDRIYLTVELAGKLRLERCGERLPRFRRELQHRG